MRCRAIQAARPVRREEQRAYDRTASADSSVVPSDESAVDVGDSRSCEDWDFDGMAVRIAKSGVSSRYRLVCAARQGRSRRNLPGRGYRAPPPGCAQGNPAEARANPVSRERFVIEAEITGNLEHPGIVPVYGMGTYPDGRPFYAMRFVKGEDLGTAIRRFHAGTRS